MKFSTCSASNCSALLCRAVTTDDEDVAKQAIEVWNTIAEEEIDRQQVGLKCKQQATEQQQQHQAGLQAAHPAPEYSATLAVLAHTDITAVQTPTWFSSANVPMPA